MLKIHEDLHKNSTATTATHILRNIPNESKEKVVDVEDKNVHIPKFRNVICQNILQASSNLPTQQHSKTKSKFYLIIFTLHKNTIIFVIHPVIEKTPSKFIRNSEIEHNNTTALAQQIEDEDKHFLLPCEFCGASCTIESLEKHQMLCGSNLEICSRCQKYFTYEQLTSHVCSSPLTERGLYVIATIKYRIPLLKFNFRTSSRIFKFRRRVLVPIRRSSSGCEGRHSWRRR